MKMIDASVATIDPFREGDPLYHIETIGRVCYKSESKRKPGSDITFVQNIIKRGHEAVLEHSSFIFHTSYSVYEKLRYYIMRLNEEGFPMFLHYTDELDRQIISGNVRAWRDFCKGMITVFHGIPPYIASFTQSNETLFPEFISNDCYFGFSPVGAKFEQIKPSELISLNEKLIHWDVSAKFICDRGISHEIVRHRPASFCQESTRYCNYSNEDFEGSITVIRPHQMLPGCTDYKIWKKFCELAEVAYFDLLDYGCSPQEARNILPTSTKTELVMTANLAEWQHFLRLRCAKAAHPQMREVATMLRDEFVSLGLPIEVD